MREDMRAGPPGNGGDAHACGVEKGRVGDDEIGGPVGEPVGPARPPLGNIDADDAGSLGQTVDRGVFRRERREIGVPFDKIGARPAEALDDRQAHRANAGADIDQTSDGLGRRRGGQQHSVAADAMTLDGLAEAQASAEQRVAAGRQIAWPAVRITHGGVRRRDRRPATTAVRALPVPNRP